jgi:hypothetical protein
LLKIIHFDLGTNMAFAHNGCGEPICERFVASGTRAQRAAQTLNWLQQRLMEMYAEGVTFDVAHYERPFARGFDATRCGWGLAGIIEAIFGSDCVVLDSTPQAIKSFALGKAPARKKTSSKEKKIASVAEKLLMIEKAQALGYYGDNEHEADAFLGLKYAEAFCVRTPPEGSNA